MAAISTKKMNFKIPLFILAINLIFSASLIEELINASDPNYGITGFFTPIFSLVSFIYIRKVAGKNLTFLLRVLQLINLIFIIFPIVVFFYGIGIMVI